MISYTDDYYYNYEDRNAPCKEAYYNPDRYIIRNVIASDVGMIAKQGKDNAYHFAISSLSTGEPIGGARVYLYDYQQQGTKRRGGIQAFVYADRGVHRPGDTIFLNAMDYR